MARKRYFSDEDDVGLPPSRLARLGAERQRPYILHWFKRHFEDPANETPRPDGEFFYPWGGPYDATEQLEAEFGGLVPIDRLERLAQELEDHNGVLEWAPGPDHSDHARAAQEYADELDRRADEEAGQGPAPLDFDQLILQLRLGRAPLYETDADRAGREALTTALQSLTRALDRLPAAGIGHNHPPDAQVLADELTSFRGSAAIIATELNQPRPDALTVARAARSIGRGIGWTAVKVAGGTISGASAAFAGLYVRQHPELLTALEAVVEAAHHWLVSMMPIVETVAAELMQLPF